MLRNRLLILPVNGVRGVGEDGSYVREGNLRFEISYLRERMMDGMNEMDTVDTVDIVDGNSGAGRYSHWCGWCL